MKFPRKIGNGPMNKRLNFGGDPDPDRDVAVVTPFDRPHDIFNDILNFLLYGCQKLSGGPH